MQSRAPYDGPFALLKSTDSSPMISVPGSIVTGVYTVHSSKSAIVKVIWLAKKATDFLSFSLSPARCEFQFPERNCDHRCGYKRASLFARKLYQTSLDSDIY